MPNKQLSDVRIDEAEIIVAGGIGMKSKEGFGLLEELAKEMSVTFDTEKRGDLAIQMQQAILDDNGYFFASHLRMSMISQANVTGLVAHPCDFYELTADLDVE